MPIVRHGVTVILQRDRGELGSMIHRDRAILLTPPAGRYFILEGNLMVLPATMNDPRPR
jgi:hypothetical protein